MSEEMPETVWAGMSEDGRDFWESYPGSNSTQYHRTPQWQDISTAPRDGTDFSAGYYDITNDWHQTVAWANCNNIHYKGWSGAIRATHWQHLPTPPEKKDE